MNRSITSLSGFARFLVVAATLAASAAFAPIKAAPPPDNQTSAAQPDNSQQIANLQQQIANLQQQLYALQQQMADLKAREPKAPTNTASTGGQSTPGHPNLQSHGPNNPANDSSSLEKAYLQAHAKWQAQVNSLQRQIDSVTAQLKADEGQLQKLQNPPTGKTTGHKA